MLNVLERPLTHGQPVTIFSAPYQIASPLLEEFVATLYAAYAQATTVPVQRDYQIGGYLLRLCATDKRLLSLLTPALAHLATRSNERVPDLTIYLGERARTGIALPPFPVEWQLAMLQGEVWGIHAHSEQFQLFFQPAQQLLSCFDRTQQRAIFWIQDIQQLSLTEASAPMLTLLHWWLGTHGQQVVHGAAVGTAAGGVLLVGKSGVGKSTTALHCLRAGLLYIGDDYCLVETKANPIVHSLYSSSKIHFPELANFPNLRLAHHQATYLEADKSLCFLHKHFQSQITSHLPLRALLVPQVTGHPRTRVTAISPAAAMLALAPSTAFQLPGAKRQTMQQLSEIVRCVPGYRLDLGIDGAEIATTIVEFLEQSA
ncbi:hypothetical protein BH10CHL1_BH10CHL1_41640 [soil metagenome]